MTGLDASNDTILSIACFVTNAQLGLLDQHGYEAVIHHSSQALANMNEWCIKTHTASGLVDQCISSTMDASTAASGTLAYIRKLVPNRGKALLAGNSVHADKMFLMHEPWKQVLDWLHYRILDVSSIKEAARRWSPEDVLDGVPKKQLKHEAKADILESIEEARYYQSLFRQMQAPSSRTAPAGSFNSSSTMDGSHDVIRNAPTSILRKDSYGNTITQEAERIEATFNSKRKAAEVDLHYPHRDGGREPKGQSIVASAHSLQSSQGSDAAIESDQEGFRTDVP